MQELEFIRVHDPVIQTVDLIWPAPAMDITMPQKWIS